jgi:pullulanase
MRRFLTGAVLALLFLGLADVQAKPLVPESVADRVDVPRNAGGVLIVHYIRPDGVYDDWNLWCWGEGADGRGIAFDRRTDAGRYAVIAVGEQERRRGIIVRKGNWTSRDIGHDRWIGLDDDGVTEVWLVSGEPRIFTDPADVDLTVRLTAAFLDSADTITLCTTGLLEDGKAIRVLVDGQPGTYRVRGVDRSRDRGTGRLVYDVRLNKPVATKDVASLSLAVADRDPLTVYARDVLTEDRFTAFDAELGSRWSPESTTFRVWSPVSDSVDVLLYEDADAPRPARTVAMSATGRGVWEATVKGDLHGAVYCYAYQSYGKRRVAADINCYAATLDSGRSVVVDLSRTDPDGWTGTSGPRLAQPTDEIVYEIHVRDLSIADPSCPPEHRGTYLGLIHRGEAFGVTTGLAHLEELGATAVHLLPVHDFTAPLGQYNWGYWTALFNVPEGNYSTNPHDPLQAITDLKAAIAGLHDAGIRVILDVVYNHTSSSFEYSPFDQSVPWYYFRTSADGTLLNDAGVGNSIADERPMVRKYIVDSTKYWVTEYGIDGMRFDLIGTHHPETVQAICDAVLALRPDLTLYGEPWTGGGPIHFNKGTQRGMRMGVFNDHLRNAIRGDLDGDAIGFATGPGGDLGGIRRGVAGAIDDFADEPIEVVNYASAHDNLTLWDKILRVQPDATDDDRRSMQKLALGVVLTSQGIAFLHGGSAFARTKGGNHNSYNAGDEVNLFDWERKAEYIDVFRYVQGLIELRRSHPAFRLADDALVRRHLDFLDAPGLVAFTLDGAAVDDPWRQILVAYNGEGRAQTLRLPGGDWTVVVDSESAGVESLGRARGSYRLPAYSMVVLHR